MESSWRSQIVLGEKIQHVIFNEKTTKNINCNAIGQSQNIISWENSFLPFKGWKGPIRYFSCHFNNDFIGYIPFAKQQFSIISVNSLAGYYWPFRTIFINDNSLGVLESAKKMGALLAQNPLGAMMRFGPISSRDEALLVTLQVLIDSGWFCLSNNNGPVFELAMPDELAILRKTMSSSLLKNIEYCNRRLHKTIGPVTAIRHVMRGSVELLAQLEKIESNSWVAKQDGEVKFVGEQNRKFWLEMSNEASEQLEIVFWVLECNGIPIAFSAHLETFTTIYIVANSFDDEWKTHSPGSILTFEVLKDAIVRGKKNIDWGQGDSGYKQRWGASQGASMLNVMLFRPNLIGKILAALAKRALPSWHVGMRP